MTDIAASNDVEEHTKHKPFDYRNASVDEIRQAALAVEERMQQRQGQEGSKGDAEVMTQEEREDGAARLLQGQYS